MRPKVQILALRFACEMWIARLHRLNYGFLVKKAASLFPLASNRIMPALLQPLAICKLAFVAY